MNLKTQVAIFKQNEAIDLDPDSVAVAVLNHRGNAGRPAPVRARVFAAWRP